MRLFLRHIMDGVGFRAAGVIFGHPMAGIGVGSALCAWHKGVMAFEEYQTLSDSPYATGMAAAPLTDEPCPYAPQRGVHCYHFAMSLCSQKVRWVLEEKQVRWTSQPIYIMLLEQYEPAYVRINPRCVVPALVVNGNVTTDSENILRFVERRFSGPALLPSDPEALSRVNEWTDKTDALPIEHITYADLPGIRKRLVLKRMQSGHHEHKVERLRELMEKYKDDAYLYNAYKNKAEVTGGIAKGFHDPQVMDKILRGVDGFMDEVERQLAEGPFKQGGFLASDSFTLADIELGIVLNRFAFLGLAPRFWRYHVDAYTKKLFARPGFVRGVKAWEGIVKNVLVPTVMHKAKGLWQRERTSCSIIGHRMADFGPSA